MRAPVAQPIAQPRPQRSLIFWSIAWAVIGTAVYTLSGDSPWRGQLPAAFLLFASGAYVGFHAGHWANARVGRWLELRASDSEIAKQRLAELAAQFPRRWKAFNALARTLVIAYFLGVYLGTAVASGCVLVALVGLGVALAPAIVGFASWIGVLAVLIPVATVALLFILALLVFHSMAHVPRSQGLLFERHYVFTELTRRHPVIDRIAQVGCL